MRVVGAERREDSRLTCVVQGLARVRVLEQTQKAPYVRATVQVLYVTLICSSYL
jgi:Lon protease-like protein